MTDRAIGPGGAAAANRQTDDILAFLRRYADDRLNSRLMDERRSLPVDAIHEFAARGLFGLQIEREYGGLELTHHDTYRVLEQLAAIDPNLMLTVLVHSAIGVTPIRHFASPEIRAQVLPRLSRGRIAGLASSEPGMGSHLSAMTTRVHRTADGDYELNGGKCWISLGAYASYINVFAQLVDDRGKSIGITGLLVDTSTQGFVLGSEAVTVGMRAIPQHEISFNRLRIPATHLLGAEGQGLEQVKTTFGAGRVMLGAAALGAMKRSMQLVHRFAARRTIAGGRLIDNGHTQQVLADCAATIQAVESLVQCYAHIADTDGEQPTALPFAIKILACELLWSVIDRCVQLLGARGFLDTNIIGQFHRDYRLFRLFEGATEAMAAYLGWNLLARPRQLLQWPLYAKAPQALRTTEALETLAAAARESGSQHRDRLAQCAGNLASWSILHATVHASDAGSELDAYTRAWCDRQLEDRLSTAARIRQPAPHLPTAKALNELIGDYALAIGDTEQRQPGEQLRLDPLLGRDYA